MQSNFKKLHMSTISAINEVPVLDIDPYDIDVLSDPYGYHQALRDTAPVVYIKAHDVYAVGRYAECKTVMSDWPRFCHAGGAGIQDIRKPGDFRIPSKLVETDPPEHTPVRAAVLKVLSPLVIRRFKEGFIEKAERHVDRLLEMREFDGVAHCTEPFVLEAFSQSVGLQLPREETLAIGDMRFNQSGPKNALYFAAMEKAAPYLEWFESSVQREAVLPGSLADLLFKAEDEGALEEGIATNVMRSIVGGGTDSTIAGIGFTLHQLARHPAQWDKVRAEPIKVKAAFEEGIRHESPFQVTFRTTVGEVELSGMRLAPDMKIGAFIGAGNRDPRFWDRPEEFDIDRPNLPGTHIALGAGIHTCLGQMIARAESEALIGALVRRVRSVELTGPVTYRPINQMRTLKTMPLRVVPA
jgi:cytochrome P450